MHCQQPDWPHHITKELDVYVHSCCKNATVIDFKIGFFLNLLSIRTLLCDKEMRHLPNPLRVFYVPGRSSSVKCGSNLRLTMRGILSFSLHARINTRTQKSLRDNRCKMMTSNCHPIGAFFLAVRCGSFLLTDNMNESDGILHFSRFSISKPSVNHGCLTLLNDLQFTILSIASATKVNIKSGSVSHNRSVNKTQVASWPSFHSIHARWSK